MIKTTKNIMMIMRLVLTIVARWFLKYMLTMLMRTMMMMTMVMMVTMLTIVAGWFGKLQTCLLTFVCHHQIFLWQTWTEYKEKQTTYILFYTIWYIQLSATKSSPTDLSRQTNNLYIKAQWEYQIFLSDWWNFQMG